MTLLLLNCEDHYKPDLPWYMQKYGASALMMLSCQKHHSDFSFLGFQHISVIYKKKPAGHMKNKLCGN